MFHQNRYNLIRLDILYIYVYICYIYIYYIYIYVCVYIYIYIYISFDPILFICIDRNVIGSLTLETLHCLFQTHCDYIIILSLQTEKVPYEDVNIWTVIMTQLCWKEADIGAISIDCMASRHGQNNTHFIYTDNICKCSIKKNPCYLINSSPPSAAYMRQWIKSALVDIIAYRLFGTKPLSKPLLGYCQLDPWEQTSVKF